MDQVRRQAGDIACVIGIDPGLRKTTWAMLQGRSLKCSGEIESSALSSQLPGLITSWKNCGVQRVAIERPFPGRTIPRKTLIQLSWIAGVIYGMCISTGISVEMVSLRDARKCISKKMVGDRQVKQWLQQQGVITGRTNTHQRDAVMVALAVS